MQPLQKTTLYSIINEFPTFEFDKEILEELVDPKMGVITAFGDILSDIEALLNIDLDECGIMPDDSQGE